MEETLRYLDPHYEELQKDTQNLIFSELSFMREPMPLFILLSIYLTFVLWLGPRYMASRPAYDINNFIILYNISQILWNSWAIYKFTVQGHVSADKIYDVLFKVSEKRRQTPTQEDVYLIEMMFQSRLWDLMDTVILILTKNLHRVTFLHVYHHSSVCVVIWFFMKYILVEQGTLFSYINCIVHVIMYSYYLLAALGPKYRKYLWWKKYLTMLQLIQFSIMISYLISTIVIDSNLIKLASYIFLAYAASFFILFLNFFSHTYTKKTK